MDIARTARTRVKFIYYTLWTATKLQVISNNETDSSQQVKSAIKTTNHEREFYSDVNALWLLSLASPIVYERRSS